MEFKDIDKINFIVCCNNKERVNNINNIIKKLNWQNLNKVKINYTVPLYTVCEDNDFINALYHYFTANNNPYHLIGSLGCFLSHYYIISEAYHLNYQNILVFEDDIFINNYDYFNELLNNIPDDADFIHFESDSTSFRMNNNNHNIITQYNEYYFNLKNIQLYSTMCYYCSRKMIEKIYNFYINKKICYADCYQYLDINFDNINIYVPKTHILENLKFKSTINI